MLKVDTDLLKSCSLGFVQLCDKHLDVDFESWKSENSKFPWRDVRNVSHQNVRFDQMSLSFSGSPAKFYEFST
jgi:hypothetical protein